MYTRNVCTDNSKFMYLCKCSFWAVRRLTTKKILSFFGRWFSLPSQEPQEGRRNRPPISIQRRLLLGQLEELPALKEVLQEDCITVCSLLFHVMVHDIQLSIFCQTNNVIMSFFLAIQFLNQQS